MRWGSLRCSPKPYSRDRNGLRAFGARNSLFLSPYYSSIPNLFPQSNIPRTATASGPQLYELSYLFSCMSTTYRYNNARKCDISHEILHTCGVWEGLGLQKEKECANKV